MSIPEPLTPPDCDTKGAEPPWELFVQMAVEQFGVTEEVARAAVREQRKAFWNRGRTGA